MAKVCPAAHLKSTAAATSLTVSASPPRTTIAAIVGGVVFGVMMIVLFGGLIYVGWVHNRGLDPNDPQRRLQFPRLRVFRAWIDPQAQMFSISLGPHRGADDAESGFPSRRGAVVARPAPVLHEPLPPYEHPPPYLQGSVTPPLSGLQAARAVAGNGAASDTIG